MNNLLGIGIFSSQVRYFVSGVTSSKNIVEITLDYKEVQRTNESISITASTPSTITSWQWTLLNTKTGEVVDTSTDQNPTFDAIPTFMYCDLRLVALNDDDVYFKNFRRAFVNHLPKPTEAECDVVIDFSSTLTYAYYQDFAGSDNAGKS